MHRVPNSQKYGVVVVNIRLRSKSWSNSLGFEIGGPALFNLIIVDTLSHIFFIKDLIFGKEI